MSKAEIICNICGCPKRINYTEFDSETGQVKHHSHLVGCLGHVGIKPELWNRSASHTMGRIRSPGYEDFYKPYQKPKRRKKKV